MTRGAFKMKLYKGFEDEYKKRHDEIWPELKKTLSDAGISDYSIYLDEETGTLFGFRKVSEDNTAGELSGDPIVKRWWDYMADIMETNPDNSPVSIALKEVFHLD